MQHKKKKKKQLGQGLPPDPLTVAGGGIPSPTCEYTCSYYTPFPKSWICLCTHTHTHTRVYTHTHTRGLIHESVCTCTHTMCMYASPVLPAFSHHRRSHSWPCPTQPHQRWSWWHWKSKGTLLITLLHFITIPPHKGHLTSWCTSCLRVDTPPPVLKLPLYCPHLLGAVCLIGPIDCGWPCPARHTPWSATPSP